jgi:hypothetical protein
MYPFNFRPAKKFIDFRKIFIAMPFDNEYETIYTDLIVRAIEKVNIELNENEKLTYYRGKDPKYTRSGWLDILENLYTARIVIGVLTGDNANVFYELGIAHATQQIERQILIAERRYNPKFDLKDLIYIPYNPHDLNSSIGDLSDGIKDTLRLYDLNNDKRVALAESKLSSCEFDIIRSAGSKSHFFLSEQAKLTDYEGLAHLCHAGLLRLSAKSTKTGNELKIEYSYYWTDLGNAVLNRLKIISDEEWNKRLVDYRKSFLV